MSICTECNHTITENGMLDNTMCEPCGIQWWQGECESCGKVRESECAC